MRYARTSTARRRRWPVALSAGVLVPGLLGLAAPSVAASESATGDGADESQAADDGIRWQLKHVERFGKPFPTELDWERDDFSEPLNPFDDGGDLHRIWHGELFDEALAETHVYRASHEFGRGGWLTAELATRADAETGELGELPALRSKVLPGHGRVAEISVPNHTDALLIRPTDALPPQYRVEYELTTLDFGGMRDGSWEYDGRYNGYDVEGTKTQHPWTLARPTSPDPASYPDVRAENGFYFLGIVDYADPRPANNIFRHARRKVVMDQYAASPAAGWSRNYDVCDPSTGELYRHHSDRFGGNAVNMLFLTDEFRDGRQNYNEFMMETDCGSFYGGDSGVSIVSAGELQPELMPETTYTFAIERTYDSYVLEMSGEFLHGEDVLRYERGFIGEDGRPIWHYNVSPDEYDGQFDRSHTITGQYGTLEFDSIWPSDSAYPDYFIIGIPHTNYYEGSASIDNLKLFVPKG
jgi:hypothetical protein